MKFNKIHWFILVSVLIIILDLMGFLGFIKWPFDKIVITFKQQVFTATLSIKNFGNTLFSYPQISKIYEENQRLKNSEAQFQSKVRYLTLENEKLRLQLGAPFPSSYKFVPAQVIGFSRFMEVAAGSDQNVRPGQIVVNGETLVGKIEKTTPGRSTVLLVWDPDFKIAALSSRGTRGEVIGQSAGTVLFTKILQKDPLFLEDQIVTAGAEFTPPNLLIGKISHITALETATYKQGKIEPAINYEKENMVFIINSL